jgi:hypothetical protein
MLSNLIINLPELLLHILLGARCERRERRPEQLNQYSFNRKIGDQNKSTAQLRRAFSRVGPENNNIREVLAKC